VFGPITQGAFLKEMGIQSLVLKFLSYAGTDQAQLEHIKTGYLRLTETDQMGSIYKVLAVLPAKTPNLSGFASCDLDQKGV
jgi:NADH dehydrogenase [ubiquinone] 1 alpha subcomplex assembly factor 7